MTDLMKRFERLEAGRLDLIRALREADPPALVSSPEADRWSALQIVAHLISAEKQSLGYLQKKMSDPVALPEAGMGATFRSLVLALALVSPLKFKAPKGVDKIPPHQDLDDLVGRWDAIRAEWRVRIEDFPPELERKAVFRHPRAGRLTLAQTLGFLDGHVQHHRRQITRLLSTRLPRTIQPKIAG
ncbi:MAG TPA: DinB family protein [Thermoanaerobaculia bacterium]|nr:DinB family protein [Thermoanaerobaculia bacterium]